MATRVTASTVVRLAMFLALLATLGAHFTGAPARGQIGPASHQDGPQVHYLFGSGSTHGGRPVTLRVEMTGPAPAGGAAVVLTSERPDIIPLPGTVTVPAGETELTFSAGTNPVATSIHVRVSAGYGGVTQCRELMILEPRLRVLYLQSVIRGGGQGRITVCLTGAAPSGGTTVNLASMTTLAGGVVSPLDVPLTITIPAGEGCLSIAVDAAAVSGDTPVTVTASYGPRVRSADAIVRDFAGPPPPTATATSTLVPAPVFSFTVDGADLPVVSGGVVDFEVCLTSGDVIGDTVSFDSSATDKATSSPASGSFAAVGDCEDATLTDVVGGTGSTSGQVRLQLRQGLTLLGETGDIGFPGDPATPTATNTPEPTATATNTAVPALSFGCQTLNLASFDGTYAGAGFNSFAFLAGEIITANASTATGSAAVTFELNFTPDGGTVESSSTAIPGTLIYNVPAAVDADVTWATNAGDTTWSISCAAG